ncbi:DUF2339 domain-containing protein [Flavobacterium sp.]|uniref:DUF2339 domain-containing protein n=1 Tax=Flavobacterium sp. TaxID=239 RepID=UPI003C49779E
MAILIFLIIVGILFLFLELKGLKSEAQETKSLVKDIRIENSKLKKDLLLLKKKLEEGVVPATATPEIQEIILTQEKEILLEPIPKPFSKIEDSIPPIITPVTPPLPEAPEPVVKHKITSEPLVEIEKTIPLEEPVIEYVEIPKEESAFSKFIKKAEKQFADNWTGILGTFIMVLGIGYLSIYTAMKVAPLYRILTLWFYAGLLFGSYYFLQHKEKWNKTGLWLRSGGASLFLFGCFGASQIQALTFITNQTFGYALLGLGIGLNLYIGYIIKQQRFLSFHAILSLVILCVIPEKALLAIIIASLTSTAAILLSYKEKWEYHLILVIVSFVIFDIWFNAAGTTLSVTENRFAILAITTVFGSCMFMQYRSIYENSTFEKSAFITHLLNWVLFATGLILHSTGSHFKTFILMGAATLCFFIALKARKRKIYWLYHLDGMVSFILCALSIIMLNDWNIELNIILTALYTLVLVCLLVLHQQKEILLHKIFLGINHVFVFLIIVMYLLINNDTIEINNKVSLLATTILTSLFAFAVPILSAMKKEYQSVDALYGEKSLSLNGLASIIISLFVFYNWTTVFVDSFYYVVLIFAVIWCFANHKFDSKTFHIGRLFFLVLVSFLGILLILSQPKSYLDWTYFAGLVAIISYNWMTKRFYNSESLIQLISIVAVNIALMAFVYKYLPDFPMFQIIALTGIGLFNHEFLWLLFPKKKITNKAQNTLYQAYYLFSILATVILLVKSFTLTTTQITISCAVLSVIEIYVLFANRWRNKAATLNASWQEFRLINSELLLFNILLFGFACLDNAYLCVYFTSFGLLTFFGYKKWGEFKRFNYYSFGLIMLSIITTIYFAINPVLIGNSYVLYGSQLVCIALSLSYVYFQSKEKTTESEYISLSLPYIQNTWILLLLFIQVETTYLTSLFMILALANYGLINTYKIKSSLYSVPAIALIAIVVSLLYSITHSNNFTLIDWITQLSGFALGIAVVYLLAPKESNKTIKVSYQVVLNAWVSILMFSQLQHQFLPVFWGCMAIINLFLYHKKANVEKNINLTYFLLANLHLGFISFNYYESQFLYVYFTIFVLLGVYIYLAYKWLENFKLKNSLLIFPTTLSVACFLYLTFDKGILTFFWILESLGLLILGILLKEKHFRYVSLSLVAICIIRLMFFDLSNADFLIRALVLVGVGIVLIVMNTLFKKYKHRFDDNF